MRPFDDAIEHLDEVGAWVGQLFDRAGAGEERRRDLDTALAARVERIEARLAAGRAAGAALPWERLRGALQLTPSEQSALLVLVAIVSDLVAEQDAALYPDARVLRDVKVWEESGISASEYRALPSKSKHGLTVRIGADGLERVYKNVTDIDGLVIETSPAGGKAKILRLEQQKAGTTDTHSQAKAQNAVALKAINTAVAGGKPIRLEIEGRVDITDQIDLTSANSASKVTVGPAGKGFNESLEITAADLERLAKELVVEGKKKPGGK